MKAILINSETQSITEVAYSGDYKEIHKLIGCSIFTVVEIDETNCIYVDDEGLLNDPQYFFKLNGYCQPLAGNGLVLGTDEEGDSTDTTLSVEALTTLIEFCQLSVEGFKHYEGETSNGITMIGSFPIFGPAKSCDD